jgi:hypothetical protein
VFVVSAAEALPAELDGLADLVTVHFPWGSLLRGATGAEPAITGRLAALVKVGGTLRLLISAAERDRASGLTSVEPDAVVAGWQRYGFAATDCRPATGDDVSESRSTWAKRLGQRRDRSIWLFEFRRVSFGPHGDGRGHPPARPAR